MFWRATIILFLMMPIPALAAEMPRDADRVIQAVSAAVSKSFPGARVELVGVPRWNREGAPTAPVSVSVLTLNPKGEAHVSVRDAGNGMYEGWVTVRAWVPAQVATRRILPGERLSPGLFTIQDVNVASGVAHEFRGVILPVDVAVSALESRQTILEGQFLISSAVQKIPDVRKGDLVRIRIQSGALQVSTLGTAEESAYVNGRVRVMASKTKREFVGQLAAGGVVEVQL